MVDITFHGAAGLVTGSCLEIDTGVGRVLIDCGMFQGTKSVKALNYEPFSFDPSAIKAVVLTHAHVDHCGLIPKLYRSGYAGPLLTTGPTADLLTYVLPDAGYVQEMEVQRLNRRNRRRGLTEVEPIYTREEAERCLSHVIPRTYDKWIPLFNGVDIRFWNAAHILGSASVEMRILDARNRATSLLFSGDLGPGRKAFHDEPEAPVGIDYVFAESTYGNRVRLGRTSEQRRARLRTEIQGGLKRGGLILIPAFAVERTQELLVDLGSLIDDGEIPPLPVFVDSPLASHATEVFAKHLGKAMAFAFQRPNLRYVADAEESKKLSRLHSGAIIIAGSGMCDAGRIRHHLQDHLSRPEATVLLVGYQVPGSLGRLLMDGVPMVRIQGQEIAVRARIRMLDEYSGHADCGGLKNWIVGRQARLGIFLIHGEDEARSNLLRTLAQAGTPSHLIHSPVLGETVRLTATGAKTVRVSAKSRVLENATADWHNTYAATVLSLKNRLDAMKSDADRKRLLKKLSRSVVQ